ncbi:MAG TPA: PAS domain-containing protein, partial [Azospirillum sp.]|nr:PAS domain-containing protein [Azospirillum sp.]
MVEGALRPARGRGGAAPGSLLVAAMQLAAGGGLAAMAAGLALGQPALAWAGTALAAAGIVALGVRVARLRRRVAHDEALLTGALEGLGSGQLVTDATGDTVFVNSAFRALVDAAPGEAPLQALERQLGSDPDSLSEFTRVRERARAGVPATAELTVLREGRSPEWRRVQAQPISDFPGAVHWRVEDITARRELEHVMLREQAKLVDFMDHAPVGFFSVDQDGAFLFVNATLAKWLGCTPRDLVEG